MQKDDLIYIGHMLDTAKLAMRKLEGRNRRQYDTDENLRLALAHLIQMIGEAARCISSPFREAHPHIPWSKIIGMRHKVVHDYLHVDYDLIWAVVIRDLPSLVQALEQIPPPEDHA